MATSGTMNISPQRGAIQLSSNAGRIDTDTLLWELAEYKRESIVEE